MNGSLVNSFGFPRSKRVTTSNQFRFLLKKGKKISNDYLVVYFLNNQLSVSRLGISVAKNKVAHAVWRNRIKRIIRESFRKKTFQNQRDIFILVNRAFHLLAKNEQWQCLNQLWEKIESEINSHQ